ncbi:MAG TPA: hypothetical protein V6D33_01815 [Cyanophyceae cyanobacterium]
MKRFQVDIKPNHQPCVRQLMKKLGNVSSADAIGFLIETQMTAALARLEPFGVPQLTTENPRTVANSTNQQHSQQQNVTRSHQPSTGSHTTPIDDATNALDALLSA